MVPESRCSLPAISLLICATNSVRLPTITITTVFQKEVQEMKRSGDSIMAGLCKKKSPQTVACLRGLRYSEGSISVAALAAAAVHCILAAIGNAVESVGKTVDEVVGDTADAEEHHACYAEE